MKMKAIGRKGLYGGHSRLRHRLWQRHERTVHWEVSLAGCDWYLGSDVLMRAEDAEGQGKGQLMESSCTTCEAVWNFFTENNGVSQEDLLVN